MIEPSLTVSPRVSVVIPTYGRDDVLVSTIQALLGLECRPAEILVMDQTAMHTPDAEAELQRMAAEGNIRWVRLERPSITAAMNQGLREATSPLVLFLDDDIIPRAELVQVHAAAHQQNCELWATVGQVVQPWQAAEPLSASRSFQGLKTDFDFPFHSTRDANVQNVMAGNLCVNRERALSIGGFDENFIGAAYRFETEFARRVIKAGGRIRFLGAAGIDHLRVSAGGTRSAGSHLTSASPKHGFGDYYYAFLHGDRSEAWRYALQRAVREVTTKFHATHPWWIPVKLVGELRAMSSGWSAAVRMRHRSRGLGHPRSNAENQQVQ